MNDPRIGWVGCVAAAAIAAGCGSASSKDPLSNRTEIARVEEPVLNGVDAPNATGIVSIFNQISIGTCSGALIADNVIMTTRHCVAGGSDSCCQDFGPTFDPAVLIVDNTENLDLGLSGGWWKVKRVVVPKGAEMCGNDIALLVLETPVPATTAVPLVPRLGPIAKGESLTAFGYGPTTPNGPDPGRRRQRAGIPVACTAGCKGAAPTEWVIGQGICAADGPTVDEGGLLVGVATRVAIDCSSAVFEALSAHESFLRTEVSKAATDAGRTAPAWALAGSDGGLAPDPDAGPLDPALCVPSDGNGAGGAPAATADAAVASGGKSGGGAATITADASRVTSAASTSSDGGGCSVAVRAPRSSSWSSWAWLGALAFLLRRHRTRQAPSA